MRLRYLLPLLLLTGCQNAPGPAPPTDPISAARTLLQQGKNAEAAKLLAAQNSPDASTQALLADAQLDPARSTVHVGLLLSEKTSKGQDELQGALVAQAELNAGGGTALTLLPIDAAAEASVPADVQAAVADDAGLKLAQNQAVPAVFLAPQVKGSTHLSFTPNAFQQWRGITAFLYKRVKGQVTIDFAAGQAMPQGVPWARDNFGANLQFGAPKLDPKTAAVVFAMPVDQAAAVATQVHQQAPKVPLWVGDLLGSSASGGSGGTLPDGVCTASEFANDPQGNAAMQQFAKAYQARWQHDPGPWAWRSYHAVKALHDMLVPLHAPTRSDVILALSKVPPDPPPPIWYMLQWQGGSWHMLDRFVIPNANR